MRFAPSVRHVPRPARSRRALAGPVRERAQREESLLLELVGVTLVLALFLSATLLL